MVELAKKKNKKKGSKDISRNILEIESNKSRLLTLISLRP